MLSGPLVGSFVGPLGLGWSGPLVGGSLPEGCLQTTNEDSCSVALSEQMVRPSPIDSSVCATPHPRGLRGELYPCGRGNSAISDA